MHAGKENTESKSVAANGQSLQNSGGITLPAQRAIAYAGGDSMATENKAAGTTAFRSPVSAPAAPSERPAAQAFVPATAPVQRVIDFDGQVFRSMQEVAQDNDAWQAYSALTQEQKQFFQHRLRQDIVYDFAGIAAFGTASAAAATAAPAPLLTCGVRVIPLAGNRGGPAVRKDEVRFSDGSEWSVKWAAGVGCVYFDIRSGEGAGSAYHNDERNVTGYSASQMRSWLNGIDPQLANRWDIYWAKSKEVRGA